MAFVNRIFNTKKTRNREEITLEGAGRSPEMNGSPQVGATRGAASPGGGGASGGGVGRYTPQRRQFTPGPSSPVSLSAAAPKSPSSRPLSSTASPPTPPTPTPPAAKVDDTELTQEEIDSMNLPFRDRLANKRDKSLSISRSGRHKYKNKQRMSVLQHDIYSDIPADKGLSTPVAPAAPSTSYGGGSTALGAGLAPLGGGVKSSPAGGGYRAGTSEPHARQYQRPSLAISGASAAV